MADEQNRRRERAVPKGSPQLRLFEGPAKTKPLGEARFKRGHAEELYIGAIPLAEYLKESGLGWVVEMKSLLDEMDLSSFEERYEKRGRAAYPPRVHLGLVLYGLQRMVSSLRGLEELARRDVAAWWLCEGLQPDHTTIARFLMRHDDQITEEFFTALVQTVAAKLKVPTHEAVIDGTVIEAASSHRSALRGEALRAQAEQAKETAGARPSDERAKRKAAEAQAAVEAAEERDAARAQKSRGGKGAQVVPHEPEAVVQRQKNGTVRPSYKATMSVAGGLVTGVYVDPTSETAAVEPLLEQHRQGTGELPQTTLMDAGFCSGALLRVFCDRGLDVLCPPGRAFDQSSVERRRRSSSSHLLKNEFRYDEEADVYICPAARLLEREHRSSDQNGPYVRYRGTACEACPLKSKCTTGAARTIKRYEDDEYKEAMVEVMRQPAAWERYQRRSLGERPFADVKVRQGLTRFRRRGLRGARLEAVLHFAALNLRMAAGGLTILRLQIRVRQASDGSDRLWRTVATIFVLVAWSA